MNLGIFLSLGDSLTNMERSGQRSRFTELFLKPYSKSFEKVYLFTYANESANELPSNVILISNRKNRHRFLYSLLLPFIHSKVLKECDVIRVFHIFGTPPAILTKVFMGKRYIYNFAYNYFKFTKIEGKIPQLLLLYFIYPFANVTSSKIILANRSLRRFVPRQKSVFIPNGVDINLFRPTNKPNNKTTKILSIGRLEKQKNYFNLIKALERLDVELTLVGNGSLQDRLINLAKDKNVKLKIIDKTDNKTLPKIYNDHDIFLLPSLAEGSPKVLLEAMACGLAVVASDIPENKDIVNEENGLICKTEVDSINRSVQQLVMDKDSRAKLGKQARLTIEKDYDISKLVAEEISLLKEVGND